MFSEIFMILETITDEQRFAIGCVLIFFWLLPWEVFQAIIRRHDSKKANYDCKQCKYWPCEAHWCKGRKAGGE